VPQRRRRLRAPEALRFVPRWADGY
jgi:hypothetical protein